MQQKHYEKAECKIGHFVSQTYTRRIDALPSVPFSVLNPSSEFFLVTRCEAVPVAVKRRISLLAGNASFLEPV